MDVRVRPLFALFVTALDGDEPKTPDGLAAAVV
jgi:hypothetical protein